MQKRNKTIDILKGLAIWLVVLGHISTMPRLTTTIYSFHMPLFIFISGYLAHNSLTKKMQPWKCFFLTKSKQLMLPFFVWPSIAHILFGIDFNFNLWYLSCLYCLLLLSYGFVKCHKHSVIAGWIFIIIAYAVILLLFVVFRFKLCSNIIVFSMPFYTGWLFCKYGLFSNLRLCRWGLIPAFLCFAFGTYTFRMVDSSIVFTLCKIATGISASVFLYIIIRWLSDKINNKYYGWLCVLGKSTLSIYCMHGLVLHALRNIGFEYPENVFTCIIFSLIICFFCYGFYTLTKELRIIKLLFYGK